MKGLIIKDLMCLRKQRVTFCFVILVTIALSVMYVLSCRFGNLATANANMMIENDMSDIDIKNLSTMALVFFMILPLAMVGDISTTFNMDTAAGFEKMSSSFPICLWKRVLSKFVTVYVMMGIGVLSDILIAAILAGITDIISFEELFGIIISAGSVMAIEGSLGILYCFLLGKGKAQMAMFLSGLTFAIAVIVFNFNNMKNMRETQDDSQITEIINFFKFKYYILFAIAIGVSVISYFLLYKFADKKRGII